MRLYIAIPCYDAKVTVSTSHSVNMETRLLAQAGIESEVVFLPGMPLVHIVRNILAHKFLHESKADKIVYVDADVGWRVGSLFHVASHKEHVVSAGVRRRSEPEDYAIKFVDGVVEQDEKTGLIEVASIGMALTAITRECLETFREKTPEFAYEYDGKQHHAFFQLPIGGGRAVGEDVFFCEQWRKMGGKVHLDPRHWITHTDGMKAFGGCVAKWLNENAARREAEAKLKDAAE